jgi:iduronate 2-sulfatase
VRLATGVDDIDGDGTRDTLVPRGIVWMQGESDASHSGEIAARYRSNLKQLMDLIRAALRDPDTPVVIGRISDSGQDAKEKDNRVWNHGDIVRDAQAAFVAEDGCAVLVTSTDGYGYSDPWHYDSAGYIDLGTRFAEAILGLQSCAATRVPDPDP